MARTSPFGAWLESQLLARDMSQAELARRLGAANGTISSWVNNRRVPVPQSCRKIASVLHVPYDTVLEAAGHRPVRDQEWPEDVREVAEMMLRLPEKARGEVVSFARWRVEREAGRG